MNRRIHDGVTAKDAMPLNVRVNSEMAQFIKNKIDEDGNTIARYVRTLISADMKKEKEAAKQTETN